jgi:hypothetical protein
VFAKGCMSTRETPSSLERKSRFLDEHKHVLALFRSPGFWGCCAVASLPALCAAAYRSWMSFSPCPVIGGVLLAFAFCVVGVQSLARGRAITNRGIFMRSSEPVGFWLSLAATALAYCLAVLAILRA